jgi:hypothetical protein
MKAADVANFVKPADLPKLIELLGSSDEGHRYWGVMGCIQLGKPAATPEVLKIMEKLIQTHVQDEQTLDVRVTAAFFLCQISQKKDEALRSLAEVIATADGKAPGKGRAWANIYLLGTEAKGIVDLLKSAKLKEKDQQTLSVFQARLQ